MKLKRDCVASVIDGSGIEGIVGVYDASTDGSVAFLELSPAVADFVVSLWNRKDIVIKEGDDIIPYLASMMFDSLLGYGLHSLYKGGKDYLDVYSLVVFLSYYLDFFTKYTMEKQIETIGQWIIEKEIPLESEDIIIYLE